jgi:P27 family predicted phage terminase small subunit
VARGRKPKPIELRDAEGNKRRKPLPPALRTAEMDVTAPAILGRAGRELWLELTERLGGIGVLDQVDRPGLTALCLQWDRADAAARVMREQGQYAQGSVGQLVAHPALAVERKAHLAVMALLGEYAATPVARARIATAKAERDQRREFVEIVDAEPVEIDDVVEIDGSEL